MSTQYISAHPEVPDFIGLERVFSPSKKLYNKGEIVKAYNSSGAFAAIVKSGTVYLVSGHSDGQRRIIDYYTAGTLFLCDESFDFTCYAIAKSKCEIWFIKADSAVCPPTDSRIKKSLDYITRETMRESTAHIHILGQRSLREKLMSYFLHLSAKNNCNSFSLPLPFSDLADYLAVDRSAMMRELKSMRKDGLIITSKRKITVLNINP